MRFFLQGCPFDISQYPSSPLAGTNQYPPSPLAGAPAEGDKTVTRRSSGRKGAHAVWLMTYPCKR